jgi:hypothetical protein
MPEKAPARDDDASAANQPTCPAGPLQTKAEVEMAGKQTGTLTALALFLAITHRREATSTT